MRNSNEKTAGFTPLFLVQFLGVLNDNLLKSMVCFMAVTWESGLSGETVISVSAALLIIPYLLLSPLAGHLALRFSKREIVKWLKFAEIPIMLVASVAFFFHKIELGFVSIFLMGAQSALYSPAKYGLIKEIRNGKDIAYATGVMEMLSFIGILLATGLAGIVSEFEHGVEVIIFSVFLFLAIVGWLFSTKIRTIYSARIVKDPKSRLNPVLFLLDTFRLVKKTKGLHSVIIGISFFWMVASLMQMNLFVFCPEILGMDSSSTGIVISLLSIGIGAGCFFAGKLLRDRVEPGMAVLALFCMTCCFYFMGFWGLSKTGYLIVFVIGAFFSGMYKIPLNAWLLKSVNDTDRGKVLAYLNMIVFICVLLSAGLMYYLNLTFGTVAVFKFCFFTCLIALFIAFAKVPAATVRFVFFMVAKVLYRSKLQGLQHVPTKGGALLIANHVSFLDSFLLVLAVPRNMRFVMHEKYYKMRCLNWFFRKMNMICIGATNKEDALNDFNKRCQDEIANGHIVCIFPEGKLSRNGKINPFKKGAEYISKEIQAPIIPIYMHGVEHTPLAWNIHTGKLNGFGWKRWRRKVTLMVGAPIYNKPTTTELRNVILAMKASVDTIK